MLRSLFGGHSLKDTCLSWTAKCEMPKDYRRILGRHSLSSAVVDADSIYARDLSFGPVRALGQVIGLINAGTFLPDAARSNYFTGPNPLAPRTPTLVVRQPFTLAVFHTSPAPPHLQAAPPDTESVPMKCEAGAEPGLCLEPMCIDSSEEEPSDSESTSNEAASDPDSDDAALSDRAEADSNSEAAGVLFVRNARSKVVHKCHTNVSSEVLAQDGLEVVFGLVTRCGRSVDRKFEHIPEIRDSTYKCRVCFRSAKVPMSAGP